MPKAAGSELSPASAEEVEFRPFHTDDAAACFALNEQWISKHFGMEERDHLNLRDPEGTILDRGGHILMAVAEGVPVGCCALIPEGEGEYELAKMAVAESMRGRGVGRELLERTLALARSLGAQRLTLGSSTKLPDAVHLYESVGFRHIPPERRVPSPYARASVFMEMDL